MTQTEKMPATSKKKKHGRVTQELLLVKKIAELIKQIERKHIHIVDGANEVRLELLYLPADVVLLLCRILVDEEVVEQVTILRILETGTVQFVIKFLYRHIIICFILSI